jgi:glycosyltransferase involved in cell wall biosynthesis
MRIAHLINDLGFGGAEVIVASLAASQARQGHSVRIICTREIGPQPLSLDEVRSAGVSILEFHKGDGPDLGTLARFWRYLRDERIDVVHAHNHLVHHYGAIGGRVARTPAILNTLHGTASLQSSSKGTKAIFWCSGMLADRVVSVCSPVQSMLEKEFPLLRSKLRIVDNGIDLWRFLTVPRRTSGPGVTFGTMGRFEPVKGHKDLLLAFERVHRKHPTARLKLLGDGTLMQELQALTRELGVADSVEFRGYSLDTTGFLADLDVYVLSSRSEGLPLTLIEAMAAGLPVVGTAVGAVSEVLGRSTGQWVCPPASPELMAQAMEQALTCPSLRSVGDRNRAVAQQYYSLERMTRDYQHVYEEILHQHGRAASRRA